MQQEFTGIRVTKANHRLLKAISQAENRKLEAIIARLIQEEYAKTFAQETPIDATITAPVPVRTDRDANGLATEQSAQ